MGHTKFERLAGTPVYQELDATTVTLVAGAGLAQVANFDITSVSIVNITLDVAVAALSGLEVSVKSGTNGRWFVMSPDQLKAYGRNDAGSDVTTTPAGVACFLMLERRAWTNVMIKAKSAGASQIGVTIGGF